MVLTDLSCHITFRLEEIGQSRIFGLEPLRGTGQPDRGQASPHRQLASNERRAARGATRLCIAVRQQSAFARDPIYVGGRAAHDAAIVRTNVKPTDIISKD